MTTKKNTSPTRLLYSTFLRLHRSCFAFNQDFEMAFYFVCLGIFLDFFDGFFARLFHVSSPLGLQLDSFGRYGYQWCGAWFSNVSNDD
jgi:CDP-diacylglycerol--serine O-phosphatidyltransferase